MTRKSDKTNLDKEDDNKDKIKNVIVSNNKTVTNNQSVKRKNKLHKDNQTKNIKKN